MNINLLKSKFKEFIKINKYYIDLNYSIYKKGRGIRFDDSFFSNFKSSYDPCFVLSTGRCGSGLITKLINLNEKTEVFHSDFLIPNPLLKIYNHKSFYLRDNIIGKEVFEACRLESILNTFISNKIYVETNPRITFFAYSIKKIFPKSKFIHLIRNPYSFIISGLRRQWYKGGSTDDLGRLKSNDINMWDSYNDVEKIAWLWNESNLFIEKFKSKYPNDTITIKSEDLFRDTNKIKLVYDHINLSYPSDRKLKAQIKKPVNKQVSGILYKKEDVVYKNKKIDLSVLKNNYGY